MGGGGGVIQSDCALVNFGRTFQRLRVVAPLRYPISGVCEAEHRICVGVARIPLDSALEKFSRLEVFFSRRSIGVLQAAQELVICIQTPGAVPLRVEYSQLPKVELQGQRRDNPLYDLIL